MLSLVTVPSLRTVLFTSAILRIGLILYSEWHDARPGTLVKYTDIDYQVFSDATAFLLHPSVEQNSNVAKGPLGWTWIGDPYTRQTYRYTPLLALLLAPNEWLHPSFGKYLFAACDIVNGVLIYQMSLLLFPKTKDNPSLKAGILPTSGDALATFCAMLHLLNPLVFSISTRGSSEAVLGTLVLTTLAYALRGRWDAAAIGLGFASHWKLYPIVYGIACLGVISEGTGAWGWSRLINQRTIRFTILSAGTFAFLGLGCYLVWGYPFLHEAYLYHLHRRDHRHNFSPYFYLIYLAYPPLHSNSSSDEQAGSPLSSFVPQMTLTVAAGLLFGRQKKDLPFIWFVQTAVFVTFNKVCTSQYFLWYIILFPLILPRLRIDLKWAIVYAAVWAGTQAIWLEGAYRLEFLGEDVFLNLWIRSLLWVMGNAWVLAGVMSGYRSVYEGD